MQIEEHNQSFCRAELIDGEGRLLVFRNSIIIDLSHDDLQLHLINLNREQKNVVKNLLTKGVIHYEL
ncbi:MAG TPA: hypothetical protein DGK91_11565 [Clostridium sp.]|jgi:hypothetical protein|nr:hypothetical protein [Clostridium sp.]